MPSNRQIKGKNLVKARQAKMTKRHIRKAAGAKRTKVGQSIGKEAFEIGTSGITISSGKETIIPLNIEVSRNIGHPAKEKRRFRKKKRTIEIVGRRYHYSGEPGIGVPLSPIKNWKYKVKIDRLDPRVAASGNVASSWISYLEWNPYNKLTTMGLMDGWNYVYDMKFKEFEGWYYANSKGTYWHYKLRDTYYDKYVKKYYTPLTDIEIITKAM